MIWPVLCAIAPAMDVPWISWTIPLRIRIAAAKQTIADSKKSLAETDKLIKDAEEKLAEGQDSREKLRMERAVLLLMRQNVTAEEIAAATGYATVSSFYRGFTRYYHCTPLEYQKSMGLEG